MGDAGKGILPAAFEMARGVFAATVVAVLVTIAVVLDDASSFDLTRRDALVLELSVIVAMQMTYSTGPVVCLRCLGFAGLMSLSPVTFISCVVGLLKTLVP